ncbi:helix-turn-helix domain-containing protein [Thermosipho atlanticus]|uniref:Helix-turn-helix n=1 Tax=Thermosipho atlanticus DSM 15807 TaxID=1123380 RepID=A0A1M5RP63_9BACT|nr:helix-turn-helix transcriptional regulator [Thermosipho atlanticus]SHH27633.1 Helix-turn-helix [Thermosipho atlanticus DSM 15807]
MSKLKQLIDNDELERFELKASNEEEEFENFLIKLISQVVKLRVEKGLSQKDLAKKIGTKQSAISRFESFSSNPTLKFLFKVLKALDAEFEIKSKEQVQNIFDIVVDKNSDLDKYQIDSINKIWERVS